MKRKLLSLLCLLSFVFANAQNEKCGTMQNLYEQMQQDATLKAKMDSMEIQTQLWIKNSPYSKLKNDNSYYPNENKFSNEKNGGGNTTTSLCGYDNTFFITIAAPTVVGQIVTPSPNCTYGGEYVRVTGLVAGRVYRISTCGVNNFDSQISIYTAGGGQAVAHNDDWCGAQSEIKFNPLVSGSYDILIDEYNCISNSLCADLAVELIYTPRPVIIIPVVVHVIHFGEPVGTGRNLSVAEINSQIQVLNEDFRRLNSDINSTPAAFRGVSDDPLVQFCLASQDEFGNPTTGIERFLGTQSSFSPSQFDAGVKPFTIWDRDSYLNLWTCDITGLTLGYATFPTDPPNEDGVVIDYLAFGTINSNPPNDLGRTATHEVGHWLNLNHIWGDEPNCSGTDNVADTPNQDDEHYGVPVFWDQTDVCSPNYPGPMYVNYMDYCDDIALSMFTYGQAARMDATLFGPKLPLQTSIGCQVPSGINETALANSIKLFPNPSTGIFVININDKLIGSELKIMNVIGEVVYTKQISENSEEINLSEFTNGVYFITITSSFGVVSKKLVLEK